MPENVTVPVSSKSLILAIRYGVLVLASTGCGQPQRSTAIDHSSPEGLLASFCQALEQKDDQSLIDACDPPLRPAWKELLNWIDRKRRADVRPASGVDILLEMRSRFCGNDGARFDRLQPDMVLVRRTGQAGQMILRERGGKWYVAFDGDTRDTEYRMKLATEIIKSELGDRSGSQGSVMEGSGLRGCADALVFPRACGAPTLPAAGAA